MNIYQDWDSIKIDKAVITLGSFDGLHKGHKYVCDALVNKAKALDGEAVVVSFSPHPREVLMPNSDIKLLHTDEEKIAAFKTTGINHLVLLPFDKAWAKLSANEFLIELFSKIKPIAFFLGYDHKFGRNREGNFDLVKSLAPEFNMECIELNKFNSKITISSTQIRNWISQGNITKANESLGRTFSISGKVVKGNQIGHTIDFPTANIELKHANKILPAIGSYAVIIEHKNMKYKGMLNIGRRPTVNGNSLSIEVNIFEFSNNIYGDKLVVHFIDRIRTEYKFESVDALKEQLNQDKNASIKILDKINLNG